MRGYPQLSTLSASYILGTAARGNCASTTTPMISTMLPEFMLVSLIFPAESVVAVDKPRKRDPGRSGNFLVSGDELAHRRDEPGRNLHHGLPGVEGDGFVFGDGLFLGLGFVVGQQLGYPSLVPSFRKF